MPRLLSTKLEYWVLHLALLVSACGSAIDSGGTLRFRNASPDDGGSGQTFSLVYQMTVNPETTQVSIVPSTAIARSLEFLGLGGLLGQTIPFSAIQISNGAPGVYDDGANTIRFGSPTSSGLCIKNIEGDGSNMQDVSVRMSLFNPSSVTAASGAEALGGGIYEVQFGDIDNGQTSCRGFSLTEPSGITYFFQVLIEGTLTDAQALGYVSDLSSTHWVENETIVVNGFNFSPDGGEPSVCVTPDPDEPDFCSSGALVSAIDSYDDTTIQLPAVLDTPGTEGYLVINNDHDDRIVGPYVEWTSTLRIGLALPSGSQTGSILIRTWEGDAGLDMNSCPPASDLNDSERIVNVALSTTPTTVQMNYLAVTGVNQSVAAVFDADGDGIPGTGDYIYLVQNAVLTENAHSYPVNLRMIAEGDAHTCGLDSEGCVYCWGQNEYGQLGTGEASGVQKTAPTAVDGPFCGVSTLTAGANFTCAIRDGAAYCWGDNQYGQLGINSLYGWHNSPEPVNNLSSGVTAIGGGEVHACAVQNGAAFCWGANTNGILGDGTNTDRLEPEPVFGWDSGVTAIKGNSAGSFGATVFTCGIRNGAAYCWGSNGYSQLGDGTTDGSWVPVPVSGMTSGVTEISLGAQHACAIRDREVFCWGDNGFNQIGDNTSTTRPTPVPPLNVGFPVSSLTSGYKHTCAVVDQEARCWGTGLQGQTGSGSFSLDLVPVDVTGFSTGVAVIHAGERNSCAARNNTLSCWGISSWGQIGNDQAAEREVPFELSDFSSASAISSGPLNHSCAIEGGALSCWGNNGWGQVGEGTYEYFIPSPWSVSGMGSGVSAVSTGTEHTCAVKSGAAYCWGRNEDGQLGNNSIVSELLPVSVSGLSSGVTAIASGEKHSCAVASGAAVCWGDNTYGQLGDNSTTASLVPVSVSGLGSNVVAITAGYRHTCALTSSGAMSCWGEADHGQLGDGSSSGYSDVPVAVSGLGSGVTVIAGGGYQTCAVHSGAGKCWGYGYAGDGSSMTTTTTPVTATGLGSGVTDIAAVSRDDGNWNSRVCAVQSGAAYCWGTGALGDGGWIYSFTEDEPRAVLGLTSGVTDVAVGWAQACAIQSGVVHCWGTDHGAGDAYGPGIGDGSPAYYTTPQSVTGSIEVTGYNNIFRRQITDDCE